MASKAKVIVLYNKKGGTLKTTIATTLAYYLSEIKKKKTLIIDLDEQRNTTNILYQKNYTLSSYDVIQDPQKVEQSIVHVNDFLDLIPSSSELEALDQQAKDIGMNRLDKAISLIGSHYEYIVFDLPPKTGCVVANALFVDCATVYMPLYADMLSYDGLKECIELVKTVKTNFNHSLKIGGIIFTCLTTRSRLTQQYFAGIRDEATSKGIKVFNAAIRSSCKVRESQALHKSIFEHMKDVKVTNKGDVRTDFIKLYEEMEV